MIKHYVVTLSGAAQNLFIGATGVAPGAKAAAALDVPLRSIALQPRGTNNAALFVGGDSTVSSTVYGVRLEAGDASDVPPAPYMYDGYESGAIKLSDFWAIGTANEILHIQVVTY